MSTKAMTAALAFLERIAAEAAVHADALDPKRSHPEIRDVARFTVVHALMGVTAKAKYALAAHKAAKEGR